MASHESEEHVRSSTESVDDTADYRAYDQCVFVRYYKLKRRALRLPPRIIAGAGPHELPPGPHDGEADVKTMTAEDPLEQDSESEEFEQVPLPHKVQLPLFLDDGADASK